MSWKLRRARRTTADPKTAKCINFWLGISIFLSCVAIAMIDVSYDDDSILIIRAIAGLGLLAFPFILIFALIGETFHYGFPDIFKNKLPKENISDQGDSTWNQWIEEDRKKRNK